MLLTRPKKVILMITEETQYIIIIKLIEIRKQLN